MPEPEIIEGEAVRVEETQEPQSRRYYKPPLITPPINLSFRVPAGTGSRVAQVAKKSGPILGMVGGAVVVAAAGYLIPKFLERYLEPTGGIDNHPGESPEVDLDVEPRDD